MKKRLSLATTPVAIAGIALIAAGCGGGGGTGSSGGAYAAAGSGLAASKIALIKRSDGTTQVTYGGHPLYTYAGDAKPGDTKGEGLNQFGAEWNVLAPDGSEIDDD